MASDATIETSAAASSSTWAFAYGRSCASTSLAFRIIGHPCKLPFSAAFARSKSALIHGVESLCFSVVGRRFRRRILLFRANWLSTAHVVRVGLSLVLEPVKMIDHLHLFLKAAPHGLIGYAMLLNRSARERLVDAGET